MDIVPCDETFSEPIRAIFNAAIADSTALYDYQPRTPAIMADWFAAKRRGNFPVLGAVEGTTLLGFASYGLFRAFPAYKYTVEHSVYVAASNRGQGIGRALLTAVIAAAQSQNYHALIGVIDTQNAASIALHKAQGFSHAGTLRQVGFKFGRWLDVDFYQLILGTPAKPVDG